MSANRDSCDCRRREPPAEGASAADWFPKCDGILERPGDFLWLTNAAGEVTDLLIFLPGNAGGSIAPVPVVKGPFPGHGQRAWGWDGDMDRPTLDPSIWRNRPWNNAAGETQTHPNEWHGNLKQGRLESA